MEVNFQMHVWLAIVDYCFSFLVQAISALPIIVRKLKPGASPSALLQETSSENCKLENSSVHIHVTFSCLGFKSCQKSKSLLHSILF